MDDYSQVQPILDDTEEETQPSAAVDNDREDEHMWEEIMDEVVVYY